MTGAAGRWLVAIALLWCLVALSGCGGMPGVEDGSSGGSGGPAADDDVEPYAPPGEPLNGSDLFDRHVDALGDAEAFTVNETRTVTYHFTENSTPTLYQTVHSMNLSSGVSLRYRAQPATDSESFNERTVYYDGSTGYVNDTRTGGRNEFVEYYTVDSVEEEFGAPALDLSVYEDLGTWIDALNWTHEGLDTHGPSGRTATRYTASADRPVERPLAGGSPGVGPDSELETLHATLYVGEDGLVRELRYELEWNSVTLTGEPVRVSDRSVLRLEDVGTAEIEAPEWAERA